MAAVSMDTSFRGIKHRVAPRNEARKLIRVEVIPQNGCDIGNQHVLRGTHDVIVYVSQLDEVRRLVRTDKARADFKRAQEVYANQVATLLRGIQDGPEGDEIRARKLAEYGGSPFEIMAQDPAYVGGFGKLESMIEIEDVPAPPTVENLQASQFGALGDVIARAIGGGPTQEQIAAFIDAEVERRMVDLEARLRAKK